MSAYLNPDRKGYPMCCLLIDLIVGFPNKIKSTDKISRNVVESTFLNKLMKN